MPVGVDDDLGTDDQLRSLREIDRELDRGADLTGINPLPDGDQVAVDLEQLDPHDKAVTERLPDHQRTRQNRMGKTNDEVFDAIAVATVTVTRGAATAAEAAASAEPAAIIGT